MATTDGATLHTGWDCLWSRPGQRQTAVSEDLPTRTRVCGHHGDHRPVTDDECACCALWEPLPAGVVHASGTARLLTPVAAIESPAAIRGHERQRVALRGLMMLMAIGFAVVGFTFLTNILWIPFTIALWLCAAGLGGLAIFWEMNEVD